MVFANYLADFMELNDTVVREGRLGLFCNHTSYSFYHNEYSFNILAKNRNLKRVFIPEHGLFAELQDQITLNTTEIYKFLDTDTEFFSLYQSVNKNETIPKSKLEDIDCLVIDIQDIGSRYYTYISSINDLLFHFHRFKLNPVIYVLDKPNLAGRTVEGTLLPAQYSSFIGLEGIVHKHGLTVGEMILFLNHKNNYNFQIKVIKNKNNSHEIFINPSPNIPSQNTIKIYSGQCLFEGTILSEGRGTTRPFEIIGAPFLNWQSLKEIQTEIEKIHPNNKNVCLRLLRFIPVFHKFAGTVCKGFQLHLTENQIHSLFYSVTLIRLLKEYIAVDFWKKGPYERYSEKTAIELLAGDLDLIDFMNGTDNMNSIKEKLREHELNWINQTKEFLLYPEPLQRIELIN